LVTSRLYSSWERREQVRIEDSFTAYVKKVTYNHVINFFRRAKKDKSLQEKLFSKILEIKNSGEELVLGKELDKVYKQAIEQLPPQQKKAFLLSREEHLSYEEIGQEMGISRNTVRNHLTEAMKTIRAYVTSHSDMAIVLAICIYRNMNS
jgi:RNA polymerase sigma factor (sigma-70 family)